MIITISRKFGSGGREVGKRLADELGYAYYDKELVTEIAKNTALNEDYVNSVLEKGGYTNYAFSFAHTMPVLSPVPDCATDVLVEQQKVIKAIGEKGNCVIVGRCADVILADLKPVKIFVYADDASVIKRCRERAYEGEDVSDKRILKNAKAIDKARGKLCDLISSRPWGHKECYDLMLNTSGMEIKKIIPALALMVKSIGENR
ncbi:MAG: AAA family ATPase [Candidatus Coproplasma sp.]